MTARAHPSAASSLQNANDLKFVLLYPIGQIAEQIAVRGQSKIVLLVRARTHIHDSENFADAALSRHRGSRERKHKVVPGCCCIPGSRV